MLTLGEELLNGVGGLLVYLVERALDLARDTADFRPVLARAGLEQPRVLLGDLLDDLDEPGVAADRVSVQLAHVRAGVTSVL